MPTGRFVLALGVLVAFLPADPAPAQTIVRPPAPRSAPPRPTASTLRGHTDTPAVGVVPVPEPGWPTYRLSGYGANYGAATSGAGAYAGYTGFPRYGYSSQYGDPSFGYGGYGAYYGFPGYNLVNPAYVYRGYQGAYYGPGLTPNRGYDGRALSRGYGAFAPLGR